MTDNACATADTAFWYRQEFLGVVLREGLALKTSLLSTQWRERERVRERESESNNNNY
jgi:hypothetical protein